MSLIKQNCMFFMHREYIVFITARKQSRGKVMFSQVSFCPLGVGRYIICIIGYATPLGYTIPFTTLFPLGYNTPSLWNTESRSL